MTLDRRPRVDPRISASMKARGGDSLLGVGIHPRSRILIRALRTADIPICAGIVGADPLWYRYGISVQKARTWIRRGHRRRERLYVAIANRQVVGLVWFFIRGTFVHSGYIRLIAVAASARRQGVGSALMEFAERHILRAGPNVFLLVSAFNRPAKRFYRKRGYQPVGTLSHYIAPGLTELLYRKTIGPLRSR